MRVAVASGHGRLGVLDGSEFQTPAFPTATATTVDLDYDDWSLLRTLTIAGALQLDFSHTPADFVGCSDVELPDAERDTEGFALSGTLTPAGSGVVTWAPLSPPSSVCRPAIDGHEHS